MFFFDKSALGRECWAVTSVASRRPESGRGRCEPVRTKKRASDAGAWRVSAGRYVMKMGKKGQTKNPSAAHAHSFDTLPTQHIWFGIRCGDKKGYSFTARAYQSSRRGWAECGGGVVVCVIMRRQTCAARRCLCGVGAAVALSAHERSTGCRPAAESASVRPAPKKQPKKQ